MGDCVEPRKASLVSLWALPPNVPVDSDGGSRAQVIRGLGFSPVLVSPGSSGPGESAVVPEPDSGEPEQEWAVTVRGWRSQVTPVMTDMELS